MRKIWNLDRGDRNVLEILHEIDSHDWWGDGDVVTADAFRRELNRCNGEMNVLINSPGGDVFAAADIYTALREYSASRGRVICYVTGIAASAASVIAMAGDEVFISSVGMMMIHDPWTFAGGNAGELRETADMLDLVRDSLAAAYAAKTGKPTAVICEMMAKTTYMTADQCLAGGFADGIGVYDGPPRAMDGEHSTGADTLERMRAAAQGMKENALGTAAKPPIDGEQDNLRERAAMRLRARCL